MFLILRKIKKTLFSQGKFRSYLLYAFGEMILVVIGILIALQIDNWNSEKQKMESLQSYLSVIAGNINDDLAEVDSIRSMRETALELSFRASLNQWKQSSLSATEVAFASHALNQASELLYFNANMGGYEALKNSGVLDRMQGKDLEALLYDYYDTVNRIAHDEENHNEFLRNHYLQIMANWPRNLDGWEFDDPNALAPERVVELHPAFSELLSNPSLVALYTRAQSVAPLLLEYDRLDRLGRAFIRMTENGSMEFDETTVSMLERIYDSKEGYGYPEVITGGRVYWPNYKLGLADSFVPGAIGSSPNASSEEGSYSLDIVEQKDNAFHLSYPGGADWSTWFFVVRGSSSKRPSQDFSMFNKLVLELKGDVGGEIFMVSIKDQDDPDDGTQTNVELQLTEQWKTYEIDLARFETADLRKLHVAMSFIFGKEPQSFSVRTIRYE